MKFLLVFILALFYSESNEIFKKGDFVQIKAGVYVVGEKGRSDNPLRKTKLASYNIYKTEVTNKQFKIFVEATGYTSTAEIYHNGMIFYPGLDEFEWIMDSTASWRYPNGKSRGGITTKMDHPVTCISYKDALAFCEWAKVRLPTLDEWEVACRAGSKGHYYFEKDDSIDKNGNIWLGKDHKSPSVNDNYIYTSPVASFKPNKLGLFDIYGNVFEFCSDKPIYLTNEKIACTRGGSWWCSSHSCNFFNSVNIGRVDVLASFSNQGFRVVCDSI